jgi:hypothetical protein
MESTIERVGNAMYVVIGPAGATNFGIVKTNNGGKSAEEVAQHMQSGAYSGPGETRVAQRNINHFLTGRWY